MPLASMSNVTSTCGTPRGAGGMPTSWNLPSVLLKPAISRSPWSTWISTDVWPSSAVEKISDLRVGMVVLRSISFVITPPLVSMPSESGRHVEQQDVLDLALEHAGLDGRADGDDLVRVDAAVRLLAEELLDLVPHGGHAGHAADEDDLADVLGLEAGVLERLLDGADGALDEVVRDLVQLGARERELEVPRAVARERDERQVDRRRLRGGELDLGLLGLARTAAAAPSGPSRGRCPARA